VEVNSYPAGLFPDLLAESLTGSLYALLTKCGHAPFSATEVLEPVIASPEHANLLWMEEGSPLMLVQRTAYDNLGRPVEHSFAYFRPDRIRITLRTQADAAPRAEVEAAPVIPKS
jgi:GntR family transcriptional regulator